MHACEQERWEEDDADYFVHSSGKAAQAGDVKAVHVNAVSAAGAPGSSGAEEDLEVNAATNTNIKVLGARARASASLVGTVWFLHDAASPSLGLNNLSLFIGQLGCVGVGHLFCLA